MPPTNTWLKESFRSPEAVKLSDEPSGLVTMNINATAALL